MKKERILGLLLESPFNSHIGWQGEIFTNIRKKLVTIRIIGKNVDKSAVVFWENDIKDEGWNGQDIWQAYSTYIGGL